MTGVVSARAEPLTAEAFAAFGVVLAAPAGIGRQGPYPVIADPRPDAKVSVTLLHLAAKMLPTRIDCVEQHAHSGQFFLHLSGGRLLVVVAPAAPSGGPQADAMRAFVAEPGQAFGYHPGVWHAGVSALDGAATVASLLSRRGDATDVIELNLAAPVEVCA